MGKKARNFLFGDHPYYLAIDSKVMMDHFISYACQVLPWDLRICLLEAIGKILRCFTDDLKIANDRVLCLASFRNCSNPMPAVYAAIL